MPPTITYERAKGFGIFIPKAVLSGRGDEIIDLAPVNLLASGFLEQRRRKNTSCSSCPARFLSRSPLDWSVAQGSAWPPPTRK